MQTCPEGAVRGGSDTALYLEQTAALLSLISIPGRCRWKYRTFRALAGISLGKEHVPTPALASALAGASLLGSLFKEGPARRGGSSSLPALGFWGAEGMSVSECPGEQRGIMAVVSFPMSHS